MPPPGRRRANSIERLVLPPAVGPSTNTMGRRCASSGGMTGRSLIRFGSRHEMTLRAGLHTVEGMNADEANSSPNASENPLPSTSTKLGANGGKARAQTVPGGAARAAEGHRVGGAEPHLIRGERR